MNRFRGRWLLPALGLVLFGVALWLTPPVLSRLDGWLQGQRTQVWDQFEKVVGKKVVYDRIAPNVLAALDFQNVRILADDGTPVITAASVRLSLDWGQIFGGKWEKALRKIQIINASVSLDSRRDKGLLDHWATFFVPGAPFTIGFAIEGFNLTARWTDGSRTVSLDRGFASLVPDGSRWGLHFRGALGWEDRSRGRDWASLSVRGDLQGDEFFQNFSLRTDVSSVRTSWFDLEPMAFQVSLSPKEWTVTKVADRIPLDLHAVWDLASGRWTLNGAAERFKPSRVARIKNSALVESFAQGMFTGRFSVGSDGGFLFDGRGEWPVGSLPDPFATSPVAASGIVRSEGPSIRFTNFRLATSPIEGSFDGLLDRRTFLPEGTLRVDRLAVAGAGEARGTLRLSRVGSRILFAGEGVRWNSLGSSSPQGWVEQGPDGWNFSVEGPVDGTDGGALSTDGTFYPARSRLELRAKVTALPLFAITGELGRQIPGFSLPPEFWTLVVGAEGRLEVDPQTLAVSELSFSFVDSLDPTRQGRGLLGWSDRHLDLAFSSLNWDRLAASGTLAADFEPEGPIGWTVTGRLWDRPVALSGRWVPSDKTLVFSGSPGLDGSLHQNDAGVWSAQATLAPYEVVPGWTVGFKARATLDGTDWTVAAERLSVSGKYPWNQEAFVLKTSLVADPGFVRLEGLTLDDGHGRLAGSAVSSWALDFSEPWAGRVAVATPATAKENLVVDWIGTAPDRWHFGVRAVGLDISRALASGFPGRLSLTGTADWGKYGLSWSAQSALSEARLGDSPLGFRAYLQGTERSIAVRNANLAVSPIHLTDGTFDCDLPSRTWKSSFGFGFRFGTGDWESRWVSQGSWTPENTPFRAIFGLETRQNTWSGRSLPDGRIGGSWSADGWQAAMDDGGLMASGEPDGRFQIRAQSPFPVQGDAVGAWKNTVFSVSVRGFQAKVSLIKDFINSPLFSLTDGEASGDFTLGGASSDPEVKGVVLVRGLSAKSSFVWVPLGPVDVPIVFDGHTVRIDPVNIGPAGQTWLVSGAAKLDHLVPEEFQFTVQTDPLSVIPASYQYTGLSAVGGVNGLFVVRGTPFAMTLGGRLTIQDMVIMPKTTPLDTGEKSSLGFNADLVLVTGRKVEFLWPNENLPLLRAVPALNQILTIKANDAASSWSVTGKVALKTGEINYMNRTFVIKEGQLGFQEGQNGFDPRVSVRAERKVRETEETVTVSLRADGTLSQFSPRFESTPYRSPEELQQLVGTTLALPTDYTKSTSVDTALSLASDVGTGFLLSPFEETVKKNLQLDLFTLKTEILKKSLLNRNAPLEASTYLDNTRLFFGKYIGDDLFLQGTLAFRQDGAAVVQVYPKMVVEPEFQMELQTPFFLFNWTLLPQHPETLFVADNTVTFRWNWSY